MNIYKRVIRETEENKMFDFRIINLPDGNQIIDPSLKTPEKSLTPAQMVEYMEMEKQLAYMERMKEKERKKADRERKIARNPLYRVACMCGLV